MSRWQTPTKPFGRGPTISGVLWAILAVLAATGFVTASLVSGGLSGRTIASSGGPNHHDPAAAVIRPGTSFTSFQSAWFGQNNVNQTGSGCHTGGSYAGLHMSSDTSGIAQGAIWIQPNPSSPCSTMYMTTSVFAGEHTNPSVLTPASTGFLTFTATWTLSVVLKVSATCASAGTSGNSLTDIAELNVTPYMAIYNDSNSDGWIVPNTFNPAFHLDSRDLVCVNVGGSLNTASSTITLTQTVTSDTLTYLTKNDNYELRAAMQITMFAVSTTTEYGLASFSTSGMGSTIATPSSISAS